MRQAGSRAGSENGDQNHYRSGRRGRCAAGHRPHPRLQAGSGDAVQNVNGVNGIKLMFFGVGAVRLGYPRIETAAQQRDDVQQVIDLIRACKPDLVMNIALPYQDLTHPAWEPAR